MEVEPRDILDLDVSFFDGPPQLSFIDSHEAKQVPCT